MSTIIDDPNSIQRRSVRGKPAWEIATLFPIQGTWSEEAYLALPSNRLLELDHGCLEILPTPTCFHELIVEFLYDLLRAFVKDRGLGKVMRAPLPIRLWSGQMREPDVLLLSHERLNQLAKTGNHSQPVVADFVMEVVRPGSRNRERDRNFKRLEYARAGIAEYWIVDPELRMITVLTLKEGTYQIAGQFDETQSAASVLLAGFFVPVQSAFRAGESESI